MTLIWHRFNFKITERDDLELVVIGCPARCVDGASSGENETHSNQVES